MFAGLKLPTEYIQHFTITLVVKFHLRPLRSTDRAGLKAH